MKSKVITKIMFTLLLANMLFFAFNIQLVKSQPRTWTVDDDEPADFHTIQEAINAANLGDTIFVFSGIYYENVVVNKSISLIGENRDTTFVDGDRTGDVIHVTVDNVTITGFTVQNSGESQGGIYVYLSSDCNVSYNIVTNNDFGIKLGGSDNNVVTCNRGGIDLYQSSNNTITGNTATIIHMRNSFNNTVSDNTVSLSDWKVIRLHSSSNNTVTANIISNSLIGIDLVFSSRNNMITNNTISDCVRGISLFSYSDKNTLTNNTISNGNYGIWLDKSVDNLVYHNNFINNPTQVQSIDSMNIWDDGYPSGGNYWRAYTGVDSDHDGIGDASYVIDENNQDNYPLMRPWGEIPGEEEEEEVPFWMQWWLWAIVAIVMVGIGATLVLWKRRKSTILETNQTEALREKVHAFLQANIF